MHVSHGSKIDGFHFCAHFVRIYSQLLIWSSAFIYLSLRFGALKMFALYTISVATSDHLSSLTAITQETRFILIYECGNIHIEVAHSYLRTHQDCKVSQMVALARDFTGIT